MSNPWLKKNPAMSLWLSTANRVAGSMRGPATAQVKRRMNTAVTQATQESLKLWSDALNPSRLKPKPKPKRKR